MSEKISVFKQIEFKVQMFKNNFEDKKSKEEIEKRVKVYRNVYIQAKKYKVKYKDWLNKLKEDLEKKVESVDLGYDKKRVCEVVIKIVENYLNGFNYVDIPKINFKKASEKEIKECKNFLIFDLETTGFDPKWCDIIQIAAKKLENIDGEFEITDEFDTFVQPRKEKDSDELTKIPQKITDITNITDDMVKDAPNLFKALPNFVNFVDNDSILVAHNFNFDKRFLENKINFLNNFNLNLMLSNKILDSLSLARDLLPDLESKKLEKVAEHFGIDTEGNHRADKDCEITANILKELLKIYKKE